MRATVSGFNSGIKYSLVYLLICFLTVIVTAQTTTRDYAVTNVSTRFSDDNANLTVIFTVTNQGAAATESTTITITAVQLGRELITDTLPPLNAGASRFLQYNIPTERFPLATVQVLNLSVGIDDVEQQGTTIALNNARNLSVQIPAQINITPTQTPAPTATTVPQLVPPQSTTPTPISESTGPQPDITIPFIDVPIFLNEDGSVTLGGPFDTTLSDEQLLSIIGWVAFVILGVWVLSIVYRSLFNRAPKFGNAQPPYASVPPMDPNSTIGRRQAWQQHAQNGSILSPPAEGQLHVVKLLLGMDGINLSNWQIKALRLSQYDQYGRVARTVQLVDKKWINRLNRLSRKSLKVDSQRLSKRVRPVARGLVRQFRKKVTKKTAFLPVALDLRFEGKHGEVRIVFRLYRYQQHAWQPIDEWEPQMHLVGTRINETYTYTIHGMANGETLRVFYKRLQTDMEWLLAEMLRNHLVHPDTGPMPNYSVPDTLNDMQPIQETYF